MRVSIPITTRFLFSLLVSLTATSITLASDAIVDPDTLQQWGYRSADLGVYHQLDWELSQFGQATVTFQKIKAIREIPDWPNAYYRFMLSKEVYRDQQHAEHRVMQLRYTAKGFNTKMHPHYMLRKGVAKGNTVYIVSTDVLKFELEELPRVFTLLKSYLLEH